MGPREQLRAGSRATAILGSLRGDGDVTWPAPAQPPQCLFRYCSVNIWTLDRKVAQLAPAGELCGRGQLPPEAAGSERSAGLAPESLPTPAKGHTLRCPLSPCSGPWRVACLQRSHPGSPRPNPMKGGVPWGSQSPPQRSPPAANWSSLGPHHLLHPDGAKGAPGGEVRGGCAKPSSSPGCLFLQPPTVKLGWFPEAGSLLVPGPGG